MTVDIVRVAFAQLEYRITPAIEDTAIQTKHPLALESEFPSLFRNLADANDFGATILSLRKLDRWTWACYVAKRNYNPFEVGTTVNIKYPRFGFDNGANFIIKRVRTDSNAQFDELTLFGPQNSGPPYGYATTWEVYSEGNGGTHWCTLAELEFLDVNGNLISPAGASFYVLGAGTAGGTGSLINGSNADWIGRSGTTNGADVRFGITYPNPVAAAYVRMTNFDGAGLEPPYIGRVRSSNGGSGGTFTDAFHFWEPSWAAQYDVRTQPQDTSGGKFKAFAWFPTASNDGVHNAMDEAQGFIGGSFGSDVFNGGRWFGSSGISNPQNLFDNLTTNWTEMGAFNRYLGYALPVPLKLTGYSLGKYQWLTEAWKDWTFKGTNDGTNFTLLDTRSTQSWAVAGQTNYSLP